MTSSRLAFLRSDLAKYWRIFNRMSLLPVPIELLLKYSPFQRHRFHHRFHCLFSEMHIITSCHPPLRASFVRPYFRQGIPFEHY